MTDRDRTINTFSDAELLIWSAIAYREGADEQDGLTEQTRRRLAAIRTTFAREVSPPCRMSPEEWQRVHAVAAAEAKQRTDLAKLRVMNRERVA